MHLATPHASLVIETGPTIPRIVHWGGPLSDGDVDVVDDFAPRGALGGSIDAECPIGIVPLHADGWFGRPGLQGNRRGGDHWALRFTVSSVSALGGGRSGCAITIVDVVSESRMTITAAVETGGVFSLSTSFTNESRERFLLDALTMTVPVPDRASKLSTFHGRWCKEMQRETIAWNFGAFAIENRRGRTSHEYPPFVVACTDTADEVQGETWAVHTAWSGNHSVFAEHMPDGRRYIQCGELLHSGEICLEPGETYTSPRVVLAYSRDGDVGISRAMQAAVRSEREPLSPRPVTLNTWEAVYFAHDEATLKSLADVAASVGIERFVLDDGWFRGRRDDRAGLGDWFVDESVYPNGLRPLIEHVNALGLQFGLWVEPEMVNPDSDMYRAHPEWVLEHHGYGHVLGRRQLVVDLTNRDAYTFVRDRLDNLLSSHNIAYLKWDMNRPHVAASTSRGAAATHVQTLAVYQLLDELRLLHPNVEIESCSSGGGRIDHEILRRTERVWASDTNDPMRRQVIQRNLSLFVPPEMIGCHVGPPVAHTTGRASSLSMRAITACIGHMGVEWNLLDTTTEERESLAHAIAQHKRLRSILHTGSPLGSTISGLTNDSLVFYGVVAPDGGSAVATIARVTDDEVAEQKVRVVGLDPQRMYEVIREDITGDDPLPTTRLPKWWNETCTMSGAQLADDGIELPELLPESAVLLTMTAS